MKIKKYLCLLLITIATLLASCKEDSTIKKKFRKIFKYRDVAEKVKDNNTKKSDIEKKNIIDEYDPFKDSAAIWLSLFQLQLEKDSIEIVKLNKDDSGWLHKPLLIDTTDSTSIVILKDTFTSDIKKIQKEEIANLKYNLEQLRRKDSNKQYTSTGNCKQQNCRLWLRIDKSVQKVFIYVEGVLSDSFLVSTGDSKHETPLFDTRPSGPMFKKYTSKKYPGGNYQGLGNMPYVVFINGGFGIHGTTQGNIPKLGKKASHGCIRVHPDNAKLIFELVNLIGLEETWITISEGEKQTLQAKN